ncbi:MAG: T9SS type A sorting domain-containing protein [Bacteroidetes bacterium]|nr:T9SS type A sorting domain-containing protein [Bacteroidota bacterium]
MIVKISKMNRLMIALLMGLILGLQAGAFAQGRVIINEFSIGSSYKNGQDFIELKNVGIADANIGNFTIVLENEIIRIPSNTILPAGGFYVASTTQMIATEANNISISLNDSTAKLVDGIAGKAANLNNTSVESILNTTGKGNYFARKTDGDCIWQLEAAHTAGASNTKIGNNASIQISKLVAMNTNCISGKVNFTVENSNAASFFTMNYIIGFDANNDGKFNGKDPFEKGIDSSAPVVEINNLYSTGSYKVMLEPISGCNQQVFDFKIDPCITMAVKLKKFTGSTNGKVNNFDVEIETDADLKELRLEGSFNGNQFEKVSNVPFQNRAGLQTIAFNSNPTQQSYFRIAMTDVNNKTTYSPVVRFSLNEQPMSKMSASPNPFNDVIQLQLQAEKSEKAVVQFYATNGALALTQTIDLMSGHNNIRLQTSQLQKGMYIVSIRNASSQQAQITRLMKG